MPTRARGGDSPPGIRRLVAMIDDLNAPAAGPVGVRLPHALLRQLLTHGGWFERRARRQALQVPTPLLPPLPALWCPLLPPFPSHPSA